MSLRDTIYTLLSSDSALAALLPGGMYNSDDAEEISRAETPAAFDANGELLPCALLRMETTAPMGPYPDSARTFFVVFVYQQRGRDVIDAAMSRMFAVLHDATISGGWVIRYADDLHDLSDPALLANFGRSRYAAIRKL
jgi:hypothetical protein